MSATSTTSFYEVQGLALCPADDHPNDHCSVPDRGEWHPLFFLNTEREMKIAYEHVMESDSLIYERYEDFRMARPTDKALNRRLRRQNGYVWDRRKKRKAEADVIEVPQQKGKKKARAK